jgi:hypothetical protein
MERKVDIKSELFSEFVTHYQAITSQLQRLPLDSNLRNLSIQHLYLGFLTAKEAFFILDVDALQKSTNIEEKALKEESKLKDAEYNG